jgi:hypothetical protein
MGWIPKAGDWARENCSGVRGGHDALSVRRASAARLGLAALCALGFASVAAAETLAPTQGIQGKDLHVTDMRNMPFCEIEVVAGFPPLVNFENTTGASDCPPDKFDAINSRELAKAIGAEWIILNPRRHWTMDQAWLYNIGDTYDFAGVKATWMGSVRPLDFLKAAAGEYEPFETNRASKYLYEKGKPVYLLTPPDKQGVFLMQSWTDHVDKTLTKDKLPDLGNILQLPKGWTFSVKTLDQDLTIAPPPPDYTAHSLVDNLKNVYAGCGFDSACSYVP